MRSNLATICSRNSTLHSYTTIAGIGACSRVTAAALAMLLVGNAFGQPAQRPLRERLLERALKGDSEAQFDLGKNYEAGRIGLKQDYLQAEHWYREAANQGDPFAQASLGILYGFGRGVAPDLVQAFMWYELAAEHTASGDRITIAEMRDDVASRMTPAQIAEARKLAREWKPKTQTH